MISRRSIPDLRSPLDALVVVVFLRFLYGAALAVGAILNPDPLPRPRLGDVPSGTSVSEWIWLVVVEPWLRRDTVYFTEIASHGYSREVGTTAFQPLYPHLSKWVGLGSAPEWGLWVVSTLSAVAFVVVLAHYVDDVHQGWGNWTAWAALLTPPGFCWLLLYTEALFAVSVVMTLWAGHRRSWGWAALFTALAVLTRQQGLVLAFVGAWWFYRGWRAESETCAGGLAVIAAAVGTFLGWSLIRVLYVDGGAGLEADADLLRLARAILVSENAQTIAPGQRFAFPWQPLWGQVELWLAEPGELHLILDLVVGWSLIAAVGVAWRWLSAPERIWCAGVVALALCYFNGVLAPYMALPRHVVIAFPLYLGVVRWLDGKSVKLYATIGLAFNVVLAILFGAMRWIP